MNPDTLALDSLQRAAEALQIVLTQLGPYRDGEGAAKFHAVNIGTGALESAQKVMRYFGKYASGSSTA